MPLASGSTQDCSSARCAGFGPAGAAKEARKAQLFAKQSTLFFIKRIAAPRSILRFCK
jgi:hypothetical protein